MEQSLFLIFTAFPTFPALPTFPASPAANHLVKRSSPRLKLRKLIRALAGGFDAGRRSTFSARHLDRIAAGDLMAGIVRHLPEEIA